MREKSLDSVLVLLYSIYRFYSQALSQFLEARSHDTDLASPNIPAEVASPVRTFARDFHVYSYQLPDTLEPS